MPKHRKLQDQMPSLTEILPNIKEELTSVLRLFQTIEERGIRPGPFYKASVTLIPKPKKDTTRKP